MTEPRWPAAVLLALLAGTAPAAESDHVCVTGADGSWKCGNAAAPPEPARLPETARPPRSSPLPPLLLIDPNRFRPEGAAVQSEPPAPPVTAAVPPEPAEPRPASSRPPPEQLAPVAVPAPPPATVAVPPPPAERPPPPATARATAAARSGFAALAPELYTVQLAATAGTGGFDALARKLRLDPGQLHRVRIQRGGNVLWLLCYGSYGTPEQARAAIPAAAAGAFVKPIGQIQSEQLP